MRVLTALEAAPETCVVVNVIQMNGCKILELNGYS